MTTVVRSADHGDREGILAVVESAFTNSTRDAHEEVEIVRETWRRQAFPPGFELVAHDGRRLWAMCSPRWENLVAGQPWASLLCRLGPNTKAKESGRR